LFVRAQSGSITVDDVDISQIGLHDLRSKVGAACCLMLFDNL
jgi:ABC-type multidrug transport system fused ATPase/permease subunit